MRPPEVFKRNHTRDQHKPADEGRRFCWAVPRKLPLIPRSCLICQFEIDYEYSLVPDRESLAPDKKLCLICKIDYW